MTDAQINIAIAEVCGWKPNTPDAKPYLRQWLSGNNKDANLYVLPNYCKDLNAMADAEEWLVKQPTGEYSKTAYQTYDSALILYFGPRATARQRAENLLRVIGKWKEAE